MKSSTYGRPTAILKRAHDLDISYAQIALDLELDVQKLYVHARLPADTLTRIEAYVAVRENGTL